MKRHLRTLLSIAAISASLGVPGLACGPAESGPSGTSEPTGQSRQALTEASGRPRPNIPWKGSDAELLIADALAQCAWLQEPAALGAGNMDKMALEDPTLSAVVGLMGTSRGCVNGQPLCAYAARNNCAPISTVTTGPGNTPTQPLDAPAPGTSIIADWYYQRQDLNCNYSPSAPTATNGASVSFNQYSGLNIAQSYANNNGTYNVDATIARPEVNLCIASLLREEFPGTASGDALYLSGNDLRYLADTGRRIAIESALDFAQLYEVSTAPFMPNDMTTLVSTPLYNGTYTNYYSTNYLAFLRYTLMNWGLLTAPNGFTNFANLGTDYGVAIELAAAYTDDELQMQWRDDFASTPAGGAATTPSTAFWGPMAWYQRSAATLYGGNAMAYSRSWIPGLQVTAQPAPNQLAPWGPTTGQSTPALNTPQYLATSPPTTVYGNSYPNEVIVPWDWPDWDELGWVQNPVVRTSPNDLVQVALNIDALDVPMTSLSQPGQVEWSQLNGIAPPIDQYCLQVDVGSGSSSTTNAYAFYNNIEAQLRAATCPGQPTLVVNAAPDGGAPSILADAGGAPSIGSSLCANLPPLPALPLPPPSTGYLLETVYSIPPSDAAGALTTLHDELGWICGGHTDFQMNNWVNGMMNWSGPSSSLTTQSGTPFSLPAGDNTYNSIPSLHITKGATFVPHSDKEIAGLFNRNATWGIQPSLAWDEDATTQGFVDDTYPGSSAVQNQGALGTNAALSAAKVALIESWETSQASALGVNPACVAPQWSNSYTVTNTSGNLCPENVKDLFQHQGALLDFIDGKVGSRTVALRALQETPYVPSSNDWYRSNANYVSTAGAISAAPAASSGWGAAASTGQFGATFSLDIIAPTNDSFFGFGPAGYPSTPISSSSWSNILIYVVPNEPYLADLALNADSKYFGPTATSGDATYYLTQAPNATQNIATYHLQALASSFPNTNGVTPIVTQSGQSFVHLFSTLVLPEVYFTPTSTEKNADSYTIVARNTSTNQYTTLVDNFRTAGNPGNFLLSQAYYHSDDGGSENGSFASMSTASALDTSKPAYDPFNIPTTWVPPTNPALYNGQSALSYLMGQAQQTAANATAATTTALQTMIQEESDQNVLSSERSAETKLAAQSVAAFCGGAGNSSNPAGPPTSINCDTSQQIVSLAQLVNVPLPSGAHYPSSYPAVLEGPVTGPVANTIPLPASCYGSSSQGTNGVGTPNQYLLNGTGVVPDPASGNPYPVPDFMTTPPQPTPPQYYNIVVGTPAQISTTINGFSPFTSVGFAGARSMNLTSNPGLKASSPADWPTFFGPQSYNVGPAPALFSPPLPSSALVSFQVPLPFGAVGMPTQGGSNNEAFPYVTVPISTVAYWAVDLSNADGCMSPPGPPSATATFPMTLGTGVAEGFAKSIVTIQSLTLSQLQAAVGAQVAAEMQAMQAYLGPDPNTAETGVYGGTQWAGNTIALGAANMEVADAFALEECYLQRAAQLTPIAISTPVYNAAGGNAGVSGLNFLLPTPSFAQYSGGKLGQDFIKEYNDINALVQKYVVVSDDITNVYLGLTAANDQVNAANASSATCIANNTPSFMTLLFKNIAAALGCAASICAAAAVTVGTGGGASPAAVAGGILACEASATSMAATDATAKMTNPIAACMAPAAQATAVQQQEMSSGAAAVSNMTVDFNAFVGMMGPIALDMAGIAGDVTSTIDAIATQNLQAATASASLQTMTGAYPRLHNADAFQAGAALDLARTYGVMARRALEAEFLFSLDSSNTALPQVAAPATWADSIYSYDLSLAQTIGANVSTAGGPSNGVFANTVQLYVQNLEAVQSSMAIVEPSSAGTDTALLTFAGPLASTSAAGGSVLSTGAMEWTFTCPSAGDGGTSIGTEPSSCSPTGDGGVTCAAPASAVSACGGAQPLSATLSFSLDPWLNLDQTSPSISASRFDMRWTQLAVNLVGTGIRNCQLATNPNDCYTNPYILGDLTQSGPSYEVGYSGTPMFLNTGSLDVASLKALAAEEVLDPISNSFNQSYVQSVARVELQDRPFSGTYTLTLYLTPDVQLQNIQSVQILAGESFWVRQTVPTP